MLGYDFDSYVGLSLCFSDGSGTMRAAGHEPPLREESGTLKHPSKDPSPPIPPKVNFKIITIWCGNKSMAKPNCV